MVKYTSCSFSSKGDYRSVEKEDPRCRVLTSDIDQFVRSRTREVLREGSE